MISSCNILKYHNHFSQAQDRVAQEFSVGVVVNGQTFAHTLASPEHLDGLVRGYLWSAGLIEGLGDILEVRVEGPRVEVTLSRTVKPGGRPARSSGFGRGAVDLNALENLGPPLTPSFPLPPEFIIENMKRFNHMSPLFEQTGAAHSAWLWLGKRQFFAEDIGRHNALDRVVGAALTEGVLGGTREGGPGVLFTTGRLSSDMVLKGARAGAATLISRGAATSLAVELAHKLGLTLIGFARGEEFKIFCGSLQGRENCPPRPLLAQEASLELEVDGQIRARVMGSPSDLESWALGYLLGEGIISGPGEVKSLEVRGLSARVQLAQSGDRGQFQSCQSWLAGSGNSQGKKKLKCGHPGEGDGAKRLVGRLKGLHARPKSHFWPGPEGSRQANQAYFENCWPKMSLSPAQILEIAREFQNASSLFRQTGAVHSCLLIDGPHRHQAEDVGRHNAFDKVAGHYLRSEPSGVRPLIFTTGRISTEIVEKAARIRASALISRGAPTHRAVELAQGLDMALIGFCRDDRFNVYRGGEQWLKE